jgi:SAM-dependent methyltransferase
MNALNKFAAEWGLRQYANWSKVWEYPHLWFAGLDRVDWQNVRVLDLGSELSPMPWFLASLGAKMVIVERDSRNIPAWEAIRKKTGLPVDWYILDDDVLPFENCSFDVVTSFSVIEHQKDKKTAINEIARVLKKNGFFALSFDICEPQLGMTFPEWNGKALTTREFEDLIWKHPVFCMNDLPIAWNYEDCKEFIDWHLQSASHHNYTVGAALLIKK